MCGGFFFGLRKDSPVKVGWLANKGAALQVFCVLGNFVAWDNACLPACLCGVFFSFFLQSFGSRVVGMGTVPPPVCLLSGGCWANRISQDPNVFAAISTVLRVALQLRFPSVSHDQESVADIFRLGRPP